MKALVILLLFPLVGFSQGLSTANEQVEIRKDSVFIPGLERYRKLRMYLPKDYHSSNNRYPVLYMMDGQNLFDDRTSYLGEWGVDEILDSLFDHGLKLIVVGIDHGNQHRLQEYSPWDNPRYGPGEGVTFTNFITEVLIPEINQKYRTLQGPEHTGIMGSSMGGLIAHYALFAHPEAFSKAGVFSASFWYSDEVWRFTRETTRTDFKLYMLVGGHGGEGMVSDSEKMISLFKKLGYQSSNYRFMLDPLGEHNEQFWRRYTADALYFLFAK